MKSLTGSAELVKVLNRFGHSVSYDVLEEIETAIAPTVAQNNDGNGICISSNIKKGVFSTFCWDNNDLCEETLSGSGTTHCTNGIIIQKECDWCENIDEASRNVSNGRKARSLKLPSVNDLEPFNVGKRFGPPSLSDVSVESNFDQMQHN